MISETSQNVKKHAPQILCAERINSPMKYTNANTGIVILKANTKMHAPQATANGRVPILKSSAWLWRDASTITPLITVKQVVIVQF